MARHRNRKLTLDEVVQRPYSFLITPEEDGGFSARVLEFPGIFTNGATADETTRNLREALSSHVAVMLQDGDPIPDPISAGEYSGRITLRVPPALHREAIEMAAALEISLNRFLADAVARQVGSYTGRV